MRVAIIGTRLSGLACALELQKAGIPYDMFERRHTVGEMFHFCSILLLKRNLPNWLDTLRSEDKIDLHPISYLKRMIIQSPDNQSEKTGELGYILKHGQNESSLAQQLFHLLQTPIHFNSMVDWRFCKERYDFVIVCDEVEAIYKDLGFPAWEDGTWIRGATVLGSFEPGVVTVKRNMPYCENGSLQVIPYSNQSAFIGLTLPQAVQTQIAYQWELYMRTDRMDVEVVETFETFHTNLPFVYKQIENVFLLGNPQVFDNPFISNEKIEAIVAGQSVGKLIAMGGAYESTAEGTFGV